jgi:hypothetical protein
VGEAVAVIWLAQLGVCRMHVGELTPNADMLIIDAVEGQKRGEKRREESGCTRVAARRAHHQEVISIAEELCSLLLLLLLAHPPVDRLDHEPSSIRPDQRVDWASSSFTVC